MKTRSVESGHKSTSGKTFVQEPTPKERAGERSAAPKRCSQGKHSPSSPWPLGKGVPMEQMLSCRTSPCLYFPASRQPC